MQDLIAENASDEQRGSLCDRLRKAQARNAALMPIGETLGFVVERIEPGYVVVSIETQERHANVLGGTHGGVLFTLADTAIGLAHIALLKEGEAGTSIEAKINFLRPVWRTRLRAEARTIQHGRAVSLLECDISDADGRLVARASATMMRLGKEKAKGRSTVYGETEDS